uniref:sensor histidine kinase n=1 Tax=uncultured Sphingomonas sp. TaxID=158754 RepID=UPI0035CC937D
MRRVAHLVSGTGSLTSRLLRGMVLPMIGLALLLGLGGAIVITRSVETVNDRILAAASRAIADTLTMEDGQITLNLSPAIFGMLEDNARDNVYYSVRRGGRAITGYADLPDIAPGGLRDLEVVFGSARYHGHDVRIVAEGRRLSGLAGPLVVSVAETTDARVRTSYRMLWGLASLEALLIGVAAVLLPLAVRWGIRPLHHLSAEMDRRVTADFTPLPSDEVPRELRDLVRAFNDLLGRLDATLQGMRRFTADASHQMRTPLSILRTHIGLLRGADLTSADAQTSIADIDAASDRLQQLLVQLLALARADSAATAAVELVPTDLNEIAAAIAAEHVPDALSAGIDLHFERGPRTIRVATQPTLAGELLSNLIDNAVRYNRPGGTVTVSVERSAKGLHLVVEDDGPGILPEDRERVLTRFTRLARDAALGGTGLGLPIAQALATAIGARLTLDTAGSGQGLRVCVSFPRTAARAPTES